MKQTRLLMGMPITVEVVDADAGAADIEAVYAEFERIEQRFSTYRPESEISQINVGLPRARWSQEMVAVLALCEQTKQETDGYFDIQRSERLDPSGLVKGWAIARAAAILRKRDRRHFYVDAGGDIQTHGHNATGGPWRIGIRNPFDRRQNIKVLAIGDSAAVATSGTAVRGQHLYNPHSPETPLNAMVSLTVIAPSIYDADRFATAAFAMGEAGLAWLAGKAGLEAYAVGPDKMARCTAGFARYEAAA